MKKIIIGILALFLVMAAIPEIVSLPKFDFFSLKNTLNKDSTNKQNNLRDKQETSEKMADFICLDENKKKLGLSAKEVLSGCLAAVIPTDYEEQSARALSAAIYSHLCFLKENRDKNNESDGADIAKVENGRIIYLNKQETHKKYGADFYSKCEKYADFGIKTGIKFDKKTADTHIFTSCGGNTEEYSEIYNKVSPYHKSVSSPWDTLCNIKSEEKFSPDRVRKIIKEKLHIPSFPNNFSEYIEVKNTTKNGTVTEAEVCKKTIKGIEIMNAFSLKSPCFKINCNKDELIFYTVGEGIPVGMSIAGAQGMAKQGSNWKEILSHYYTDCDITEN